MEKPANLGRIEASAAACFFKVACFRPVSRPSCKNINGLRALIFLRVHHLWYASHVALYIRLVDAFLEDIIVSITSAGYPSSKNVLCSLPCGQKPLIWMGVPDWALC